MDPNRAALDTDISDSTSQTFLLPSGRKIGYATWGLPTGKPIFYCHGLPGSRLEGYWFTSLCHELNAFLITVDRPGTGLSSCDPGRKVLDHASDIAALATHLSLQRYGVLGISGGGPYALACAAAIPAENLAATAVVCGCGMPDMSRAGMNWFHRLGFSVGYRWFPWLVTFWFGRDAMGRVDLSDEERLAMWKAQIARDRANGLVADRDMDFLGEEQNLRNSLRATRESFESSGGTAMAEDGGVICADWGFRLQEVRREAKVFLWYGSEDVNTPPGIGRQIKERLGNAAELHLLEGETHASIFANYRREFFKALIDEI